MPTPSVPTRGTCLWAAFIGFVCWAAQVQAYGSGKFHLVCVTDGVEVICLSHAPALLRKHCCNLQHPTVACLCMLHPISFHLSPQATLAAVSCLRQTTELRSRIPLESCRFLTLQAAQSQHTTQEQHIFTLSLPQVVPHLQVSRWLSVKVSRKFSYLAWWPHCGCKSTPEYTGSSTTQAPTAQLCAGAINTVVNGKVNGGCLGCPYGTHDGE